MVNCSIGETARRFHVTPSTLRYYEERGLIGPHRLANGQRTYDQKQLRRLAFIRLGSELGITLDVIASVLDDPRTQWRDQLALERSRLRAKITTAENASALLEAADRCTHDHPGQDCPELVAALDSMIDGCTSGDLAERYTT